MEKINQGKEETNCIKIRDDRMPIKLSKLDDSTKEGKFKLADDSKIPSWVSKDKNEITLSDLHSGIEPWLTSLFQSDHLSLPSRRAILLGWASEIPVMVEMNFLKEEHRPQSNDPDYWETWTAKGDKERLVNWKKIADDWQQTSIIATELDKEENLPEAPNDQTPF
jgi:hypothetical protein